MAGWLFDSSNGPRHCLIGRWIFLRALAGIYFSAFFSLLYQIKGLIGPQGILPAQRYLSEVARMMGPLRYWYAPTLFWLSTNSHWLMATMWIGLLASILAFLNLWPRLCFFICFVCFLSFVAAAGDFSSYQSDGMLLEAGFLTCFFAPPGLRPGWAWSHPPARASLFLLLWEWFRIYFESGLVKLLSGDRQWRDFTAMDEYYQNSPLPTWIGWWVEHLPHWFHAFMTGGTLFLELGVVLLLFFSKRGRLVCFLIVTPWELGVILTGNYAFLNYLVLALGFLLLDNRILQRCARGICRRWLPAPLKKVLASIVSVPIQADPDDHLGEPSRSVGAHFKALRVALSAVVLGWIAYNTTAELINMPFRTVSLPDTPIRALDPFRISNQYGLFAVMTRGRYEIEFQGSDDNLSWIEYPFRYKPQALNERPRIYAPYQPRFDWNLWFASLGDWEQNQIVPLTQERLLDNDPDVLELFRSNPFAQTPPRYVRAVLWQYWFTSIREKGTTGNWWRRQLLGQYSPTLSRGADGKFEAIAWPGTLPRHE
ncbi:putative integral membrane protein [Acidisarcina polymorpha]|uniref:Lipase maturation factor 2 n=1 Tax=Acidisarcina polymorpha TaxID=2211140 RepID=A0A2Z5G9V8_9BACT|nr:putative integral membrane protein [Acidisarcina polymorpha]